jgi:hypothetical protein
VGREGGVTPWGKRFFAAAVAAALLLPVAPGQAKPTKITVHAKKRVWHGYGFLPGYRPQLSESQGIPVLGPDRHRDPRYFDWYGNARYGWGGAGFYRGRWNGGSFGPCWTYTPIGMMPNCGQ